MALQSSQLQRYDPLALRPAARSNDDPLRPPADRDVLLLGAGNSGEAVTLRCQALGYSDGVYLPAAGLNNDRLPPRPISVRRADGTALPLELRERLVMDGEHPRERLQEEPLLQERYAHLLRGIPVFETYPRAGAGGHGHPAISALDIDLHIAEVRSWLRRALRQLRDQPTTAAGQSDLQRLVQQNQRRQDTPNQKRVVVIGGASGAMGNAAHHLLPHLIRQQLAELGIVDYELWGVLLGPRAFSGLTPFVRQNYRALLEAIEHMSRYGLRRAFRDDLVIASQQPPYDRVFLLDDPTLPGTGAAVTEAELEGFLDRTALSLHTLLRGTVWQTIASHTANDHGVVREDGKLCYLHTVQSVLLGADRAQMTEILTTAIARRTLEHFLLRFAGQ